MFHERCFSTCNSQPAQLFSAFRPYSPTASGPPGLPALSVLPYALSDDLGSSDALASKPPGVLAFQLHPL